MWFTYTAGLWFQWHELFWKYLTCIRSYQSILTWRQLSSTLLKFRPSNPPAGLRLLRPAMYLSRYQDLVRNACIWWATEEVNKTKLLIDPRNMRSTFRRRGKFEIHRKTDIDPRLQLTPHGDSVASWGVGPVRLRRCDSFVTVSLWLLIQSYVLDQTFSFLQDLPCCVLLGLEEASLAITAFQFVLV